MMVETEIMIIIISMVAWWQNSKTTIDFIKSIHYCLKWSLKWSLKWPILGTFSFWNKAPINVRQLPPPSCGHCRMLTFFVWEEFGQHIDWIKIPSKMEVAPRYKLLTLLTLLSLPSLPSLPTLPTLLALLTVLSMNTLFYFECLGHQELKNRAHNGLW